MADATLYWDDLKEGQEITSWSSTPSPVLLFQLSAVTWNSHRIHYDRPWAEHEGYENIVIHGPYHAEVLIQTLQRWIGDTGWLTKIGYQNRRYAVEGDTLTCSGTVTRLYEQDGAHYADLDVHVEKQDGTVTIPGTATVMLPTRDAPIEVPA